MLRLHRWLPFAFTLVCSCWLSVAAALAQTDGAEAQTDGAEAQAALGRAQVSQKALEAYTVGRSAARKGDRRQALRYLGAAVEREPRFAEALTELAGIYYNTGDYARAEPYLERAAALTGNAGEDALYGLAMTELKLGKYDEAVGHLEAYLASGRPQGDRRAAAERFRAEAAFRAEATAHPTPITLERLPDAINTPESSEYLPALTADERELVFTRRVDNRQEDFFRAVRVDTGWQTATPLAGVNTPNNEGAQALSADGRLLVFTACDRDDGLGGCDLYFSKLEDGTWTEPLNLGPPVNSASWESQPSLAANGNLLFFASRRPGGRGGADLYASGRTPEGGWTEPLNLGEAVNTPDDDMAPFFHADGATLYFMSDGHPGMGGFDLFLTRLGEDRQWTPPQNLGIPVNTAGNEGALAVARDGRTAYYATDGTNLDTTLVTVGGGRTGRGTDLYTFQLPPTARAGAVTYLRARVVDAVTKAPVAATALIADATTDAPFVRRRADGETGEFLVVLPAGKAYALTVEEPGYLFYSDRFELLRAADADEPYELLIPLQPIADDPAATLPEAPPVVLRNVLFATGSAELLPESTAELRKLRGLLREYPDLRIRLQGHTDDVGEEADNLDLSERRAAAVRDYLSAEGVDPARLSAVGFGESRPLVTGTDPESRRLNRRTEFVVLRE